MRKKIKCGRFPFHPHVMGMFSSKKCDLGSHLPGQSPRKVGDDSALSYSPQLGGRGPFFPMTPGWLLNLLLRVCLFVFEPSSHQELRKGRNCSPGCSKAHDPPAPSAWRALDYNHILTTKPSSQGTFKTEHLPQQTHCCWPLRSIIIYNLTMLPSFSSMAWECLLVPPTVRVLERSRGLVKSLPRVFFLGELYSLALKKESVAEWEKAHQWCWCWGNTAAEISRQTDLSQVHLSKIWLYSPYGMFLWEVTSVMATAWR